MQCVIGMSTGSLYQVFVGGAYYGTIASNAGGILGYIYTIFINVAITETLHVIA